MHKLPTALSCYDKTNEIQFAIDSKFSTMEQSSTTKINSLSNQLKDLEAKCLTNPVMETSESPTTPHTITSDSSVTALSIADELSDRERRKKNLILYNVPEQVNTQSDKGFFVDLCKAVYDMNVPINKMFRLGKKKASNEQPQHRPLLVALENESDKATLIARSSQLRRHDKYENIYMVPDKTKFERAKHKRLVDKLKQRRAKGEVDLVIRNGSIMKKRPRCQAIANDNRSPTSASSLNEANTQS